MRVLSIALVAALFAAPLSAGAVTVGSQAPQAVSTFTLIMDDADGTMMKKKMMKKGKKSKKGKKPMMSAKMSKGMSTSDKSMKKGDTK